MRIKKYWMMLAIALVSLCTISCGGDDDDEGGSKDNPISMNDPEGTIIANLTNTFKEGFNFYWDGGLEYMNGQHYNYLGMNSANNLVAQSRSYRAYIVSVGKVNSLSDIRNIPESGWSHEAAAIPGYGYIYKSSYIEGGISSWRYARIYAVDYMTSTSGGIMGITIKYQENWESDIQ